MKPSADHVAALLALYPSPLACPGPVLALLCDYAAATGRIQGMELGLDALLKEAQWWREFALTAKARKKKA